MDLGVGIAFSCRLEWLNSIQDGARKHLNVRLLTSIMNIVLLSLPQYVYLYPDLGLVSCASVLLHHDRNNDDRTLDS